MSVSRDVGQIMPVSRDIVSGVTRRGSGGWPHPGAGQKGVQNEVTAKYLYMFSNVNE